MFSLNGYVHYALISFFKFYSKAIFFYENSWGILFKTSVK